jgi:hypothetical protein
MPNRHLHPSYDLRNLLRDDAQRGQALVLLALAFVGLAAFIGLTVDAGILFSYVGHLRRATDAAALAAANQFRENRTPVQLSDMAYEMLVLNGLTPSSIAAYVCDLSGLYPSYDDPSLCPAVGDTARKFVRVESELQVNFAFLPIVGWDSTIIRANSISETASVDLVLVLDLSPSMSYNLCSDGIDNDEDGTPDDCDINDPSNETGPPNSVGGTNSESDVRLCVANRALPDDDGPGEDTLQAAPDGDREDDCHPFEEVRDAAHLLVDRMYFPYDRLGIVSFATLATVNLELDPNDPPQPCGFVDVTNPADLKNCADTVIDTLDPEQEADVPTSCPDWYSTGDPRGCMSTNTGDGLWVAGGMFCRDDPAYGGDGDGNCDRGEMREEAVWIAIVLSDGVANAGSSTMPNPPATADDWICPDYTWGSPTGSGPPYCADGDPDPGTRHPRTDVDNYDADDYARDQADYLGCPNPSLGPCIATVPLGGQDAVIFSIGLGEAVTDYTKGGAVDQGEQLLRYIAAVGDDGDPSTDPCAPFASGDDCGNYYFVLDPSGGELLDVFEAIASRIFTRITH